MYKDPLAPISRFLSIMILLILALMILYHIGFFYLGPFPGFFYDPSNGEVTDIFVTQDESQLQIGDFIYSIDSITLEEYSNDPYLQFWNDLQPGDTIPIQITREGDPLEIEWTYPGRTQEDLFFRLNSQWWLAYLFWLAALATFLIIRPGDTLWRLLIAFNLITALWFTTGSGPSRLHLWGSLMVTRIGVWLTVPIIVHLHLIFPKPFSQIPKKIGNVFIYSIYIIALGFIFASLIWSEVSSSYTLGLFMGLLASMVLLIIHYRTQKQTREQIRIVLRITLLAFSPVLLTLAASFFIDVPPEAYGASVAGLPLISFGYFYAISRGRLGVLEIRANRAISSYLFAILLLPILILAFNTSQGQTGETGPSAIFSLLLIFIISLIAVYIYPFFQRFIERSVLGIPLPPTGLLQSYSAQITTSRDTSNLSSLFDDLILPSLLVRQSALLAIENENNLKIISLNGLIEEQLPSLETIQKLVELRDKFILPHEIRDFPPQLNWIKVVLPLTFDKELIGVWLLGRRDPNDIYDAALVDMLKSFAQQTSLAIINHNQTKQLRALYQVNIDRHENERARLARDLHDDTLNNLALLQHETNNPNTSRDIEKIISTLRKTIHGLRPEMLTYGLLTALQDLGDTLNERQDEARVHVTLQGTFTPINPSIELHLFRIVQQACENALRHARADNINITGQIEEEKIHISIEDDGKGFEMEENTFLSDLLVNKHYGLAGMHERADLIHAKMKIKSSQGEGTTVTIDWIK
ncbi:MAG: ATP-binding protein [Anaerolineales bacterium]|jgi:signal transduction histidine kinase